MQIASSLICIPPEFRPGTLKDETSVPVLAFRLGGINARQFHRLAVYAHNLRELARKFRRVLGGAELRRDADPECCADKAEKNRPRVARQLAAQVRPRGGSQEAFDFSGAVPSTECQPRSAAMRICSFVMCLK